MALQTTNGIHHITAISSAADENLDFYEKVLGLRLVKQTVNFDDPYTYHLYYGDADGAPGTILTFFPWERMPSGRPGAGMIVATAFAVPREAMSYWAERLNKTGIEVQTEYRLEEPVLRFKDPHGLPIELIGTEDASLTLHWEKSPVDQGYAIQGFHSATALLNNLENTQALLTGSMGMTLKERENNRYRFKMNGPKFPGQYLDVVIDRSASRGQQGTGSVHHIAFRAKTDKEQMLWQANLRREGYSVTEVRDRNYFKSIYFHEPGGVLFEIATDQPGFAVDEPAEHLGKSLKLPAQYEPNRPQIEDSLPPLRANAFAHVFWHPEAGMDDGRTIIPLHGTGGNEHDLVDAARQISELSAIISPRGKVLENGTHRFFKRFPDGDFDEKDILRRARELADFLSKAANDYGRNLENLIAFGYSNGANIASAVLLLRPEVFSKAILFRPILPFKKPPKASLRGKKIIILKGRFDSTHPDRSPEKLERVLTDAGAEVTVSTLEAGHELTPRDFALASEWLSADRHLKHAKTATTAAAQS
jgi:predicted esterase/catechol 2,3-dioxygenase-like lactoylglutathione lyase family enzyme